MKALGYEGELGLFAARRFLCGEAVDTYDGTWLGNGVDGSAKYTRMVEKALQGRVSSYLYQVRSHRRNLVQLYDGSTGRNGGPKRANSAHGTLYKDNAFIDDDGDLLVKSKAGVKPLTPSLSPQDMHRAAIWVDYGDDYWRRPSSRVNFVTRGMQKVLPPLKKTRPAFRPMSHSVAVSPPPRHLSRPP